MVAVIRHGDRTPKQKMKMEVRHKKYVIICFKKCLPSFVYCLLVFSVRYGRDGES